MDLPFPFLPLELASFIFVCIGPIIQILEVPIGSESLEPEHLAETCCIIRKDFLFLHLSFLRGLELAAVTGAEKLGWEKGSQSYKAQLSAGAEISSLPAPERDSLPFLGFWGSDSDQFFLLPLSSPRFN